VNRHEGGAPRTRTGDWHAAFDGARDLFRPLEEASFPHVHLLSPAGVIERVASIREELPMAYFTDVFLWERV